MTGFINLIAVSAIDDLFGTIDTFENNRGNYGVQTITHN